MDKKDKKILYELDKDSRKSFAQIGKVVGMNPLTVRYRVNKMVEKGIIQKFVTITNVTKLGRSMYKLQFRLQNADNEKTHKIMKFLENSPKVSWIGRFQGPYDLSFIAQVTNQLELQELLDKLHKNFSSFIMKKNLSINLSGEFLSRDYLIDKRREKIMESTYEPHGEIEKINKIDAAILRMLAENSRTQIVDIAEELKISADTVIKRIKELKSKKIIAGHTIIINNEKVNQLHYKLHIYLSNVSDEKVKEFLNFVRKNNRVFAIIKVLGDWDYEIDLEVEKARQLQDFTLELGNKYSNMIKDYDIIQVLEMPKYFFFP